MQMSAATLAKLELEEELLEAIERARAVTAMVARRRAERTLAGDLRRFDLAEVLTQIANVEAAGVAEPQLFHQAEHWRARLIEADAALAEFPHGTDEQLPKLIANARREQASGRPPGAKRALFRHVVELLRQNRPD
jgi:ribosome-associated protein